MVAVLEWRLDQLQCEWQQFESMRPIRFDADTDLFENERTAPVGAAR